MTPLYPPTGSPRPPRNFPDKVNRFWVRVTEGLEVGQLWAQFEKDARSSYRLYSSDVDRREEEPASGARKRPRTRPENSFGQSWKSFPRHGAFCC